MLKERSHWDDSFEYTQHMFWLRNKQIVFLLHTLNLRPVFYQAISLKNVAMINARFLRDQLGRFCSSQCVCYDALHPSQQFSVMLGWFPGLNQYSAMDKVSCSRAHYSDSAGGEFLTSNPLIPVFALLSVPLCSACFHFFFYSLCPINNLLVKQR